MSRDSEAVEVADRVWVLRREWFDLSVVVVGGDRGLVVVDTHGSQEAGRRLAQDVRRLGDLVAVVNTHEHFDHTFGNAAFREEWPGVPVHAHEAAAAATVASGEATRTRYAEDPGAVRREEVLATTILAADHTFSSVSTLDLGDRVLELMHPGRGHTAGDLVLRVPDADVLVAGDLVEESAPPWMGEDSFPLEWADTLDLMLGLVAPTTVVVPGHGAVVDRAFVEGQADQLRGVAETIRTLAGRGVPVDQALAEGEWPFDPPYLESAVRRGYAQLRRDQRRLPLA